MSAPGQICSKPVQSSRGTYASSRAHTAMMSSVSTGTSKFWRCVHSSIMPRINCSASRSRHFSSENSGCFDTGNRQIPARSACGGTPRGRGNLMEKSQHTGVIRTMLGYVWLGILQTQWQCLERQNRGGKNLSFFFIFYFLFFFRQ